MKQRIGLALFCLCIATFFISCRTISGEYYESFGEGWGGADYEFHKDGTFKYSSRYDVGGEYGNGTFSIRFGRLKLRFETAASEPYTSAGFCFSRRDSSELNNTFHIQVRDENKVPIPFAIISYSVLGDTNHHTLFTDIDGNRTLSINEKSDSIEIRIRTVGYDDFKKQIEVSSFDSITIGLFPNPRRGQAPVDSGAVWKFNLHKMESKEIILVDRRIEMVEVGDGYSYKRVRHRDEKKLVKKKR